MENLNQSKEQLVQERQWETGDYVVVVYDKEPCTGCIQSIKNNKANIKLCISRKKKDPLFTNVDVELEKLQPKIDL